MKLLLFCLFLAPPPRLVIYFNISLTILLMSSLRKGQITMTRSYYNPQNIPHSNILRGKQTSLMSRNLALWSETSTLPSCPLLVHGHKCTEPEQGRATARRASLNKARESPDVTANVRRGP
uniref:Uncharacterized protein n=1 Tax=Hippocampus comes TaxID=109280 RepID=A0A3Q2XCM3_HIPCM